MLRDHRPAEQILDPDAPNAVGVDGAVKQVGHRGNRADLETKCQGGIDGTPDGAPGSARHRDEKGLRAGLGDRPLHRRNAAVYANPGHRATDQRWIVIEEPDRNHAGARIPARRPRQEDAGLSGTVQERGVPIGRSGMAPATCPFRGGPDPEADSAEDGDAQEHLGQPERAREPVLPGRASNRGRPVEDDQRDERTERDGRDDPLEVGNAREAPPAAVQAELDVDDRANGEEQAHDHGEGGDEDRAAEAVEANREREVRGDDDPDQVDREEIPTSNLAREPQRTDVSEGLDHGTVGGAATPRARGGAAQARTGAGSSGGRPIEPPCRMIDTSGGVDRSTNDADPRRSTTPRTSRTIGQSASPA